MDIPWDEVRCELESEHEIVSDTVRVVVQATLTLAGQDTAKVRGTLGEVLSGVLDGKWQFSSVEREEDSSGMEQVVTIASTRVKEHLTGGLVERLAKASRPGLKLSLRQIVTRPPRADIEKVRVDARRQVYEAAQREARMLNEVYGAGEPEKAWRVGAIRINETLTVPEASRRERRGISLLPSSLRHRVSSHHQDEDGDASPDIAVSTRLTLRAIVKLKRPSVEPPKQGFFAGPPR